jgi:DNA-binding LytR/AlgR family response regulator
VFLDVQLPELSGIEVIERVRRRDAIPAVVFTTAFDQYAVTAFELEAVDYLLKPFGEACLPNPPFLRVHRSHIVNLDHVERMRLLDSGGVEVQMKGGATVPVSRLRSQELRRLSR